MKHRILPVLQGDMVRPDDLEILFDKLLGHKVFTSFADFTTAYSEFTQVS